MGDTFNIGNIEEFNHNTLESREITEIGEVIKSMVDIYKKTSDISLKKKCMMAYSIEDKIKINNINQNNAFLINKHIQGEFSIIEQAIECVEETYPFSKKTLFDFYTSKYIDHLREIKIDFSDEENLRKYSNEIYEAIEKEMYEFVLRWKNDSVSEERKKLYSQAITAYVFYSCKFLIPISKK